MARIEKKAWPMTFELFSSGKRKLEFRLADFELKTGDTLVLREYDPKTGQYTGRERELKCRKVEKSVADPLRFWSAEDIKKHGVYLIEFE